MYVKYWHGDQEVQEIYQYGANYQVEFGFEANDGPALPLTHARVFHPSNSSQITVVPVTVDGERVLVAVPEGMLESNEAIFFCLYDGGAAKLACRVEPVAVERPVDYAPPSEDPQDSFVATGYTTKEQSLLEKVAKEES